MNILLLAWMTVASFGELPEEEKQSLVGQVVQVRGFTYSSPEGKQVISSEPNMKSCCAAVEEKAGSQILLIGKAFPKNTLVSLEGTLSVEENEKGIRRYALKEAHVLQERTSAAVFAILTALLLAVAYLFWRHFAKTQ